MARVTLVSLVSEGSGLQRDRWYAPLGLVWVSNYLRERGHQVEILDGQLITEDDLSKRIRAAVVGINYFINSTHIADRLASKAKERGATVVYGGQAATPVASEILRRNLDVDFVVRGDGEAAMEMLARRADGEDIPLKSIPNLAYRAGDGVHLTRSEELDLSTLPFPDRRLPGMDMERLITNFHREGSEENFGCLRPTNAYTRKGCPRRGPDFGCSFCARVDMSVRSKSAVQAYEEYRYLVREFGVDYICDDSDTWIRRKWLEELLQLIDERGPIGARFRVYGDVRDINTVTAPLLREIGVDAVLVGMESGDEAILRRNGKPMRRDRMLRAAELLGENGVRICDAYVLGLIGENAESIENTIAFADEVHALCEPQITYWNMILPLPGSPLWREMMAAPELAAKYAGEYRFDIDDLRTDFINKFCDLGADGHASLLQIRNDLLAGEMVGAGEYLR